MLFRLEVLKSFSPPSSTLFSLNAVHGFVGGVGGFRFEMNSKYREYWIMLCKMIAYCQRGFDENLAGWKITELEGTLAGMLSFSAYSPIWMSLYQGREFSFYKDVSLFRNISRSLGSVLTNKNPNNVQWDLGRTFFFYCAAMMLRIPVASGLSQICLFEYWVIPQSVPLHQTTRSLAKR